jgi:hypothetical protein
MPRQLVLEEMDRNASRDRGVTALERESQSDSFPAAEGLCRVVEICRASPSARSRGVAGVPQNGEKRTQQARGGSLFPFEGYTLFIPFESILYTSGPFAGVM